MAAAKSKTDPSTYTRLHITPLNSDLLSVVLPAAVRPNARNISYHSIETFPEKGYGFVELPTEDAEKLRKKLHGAVLKGVKLRVEPARPSSMPEPMGDAALAKDKDGKKEKKQKKDKSKKRKRDGEEIVGIALEEGRKVKRGWTVADEPPAKKEKRDKSKKDQGEKKKEKKKVKSKYTNHDECLVRTILPAHVAKAAEADEASSGRKKKDKSREVVIHEFEKTTKFPTFLKSTAVSTKSKPPPEYVDGKGWVDAEGNVVEAARKKQVPQKDDSSSSSGDSSEDEPTAQLASTSDDSASESEEEERVESPVETQKITPRSLGNLPSSPLALKSDNRPKSSGSTRSLTIKIPPVTPATPAAAKVHPLEALYKRPKNEDGTVGKADSEAKDFTFFGGGDVEEEEEEALGGTPAPSSQAQPPMTPYTRQDFEFRNVRSAAPTPDTAHPNRSFKPWAHDDAEDDLDEDPEEENLNEDENNEDEDEDGPKPEGATTSGGDQATSDFQAWFWEHRGDLNRSWKKRRRMMTKEKRYRENKSRTDRAI
ncbi:hypothetical protein GQ53DRAFT_709175 [Thozetella sp. PMI_491]|nr:hypothetical protein GQ53DRAFT_709175 [Thozetella sp. PMI_491]